MISSPKVPLYPRMICVVTGTKAIALKKWLYLFTVALKEHLQKLSQVPGSAGEVSQAKGLAHSKVTEGAIE